MNPKGKKQIAKKIVETIKVMLNKKKSDRIMMKDKEELGADSEGTETESITVETETKQNQSKKDMQANSEHEDKQTGTLSLDQSCTRSSIRQKKAPKQRQIIFYGNRIFKYR